MSNDVLTASSLDPVEEAQRWLRGVFKDHPELVNCPAKQSTPPWNVIVVLGIGSGYHVDLLAREVKLPIVAIETDPYLYEKREFYTQNFASLCDQQNKIWCLRSESESKEFIDSTKMSMILSQAYLLLEHRPSFHRSGSQMLMQFRESFLGRTQTAFERLLRAREALLVETQISSARTPKNKGASLYSIKDLKQSWKSEFESSRNRRILRVLEELVK